MLKNIVYPNVYAKTLASRNTASVGLVLPLGYNFIQKMLLLILYKIFTQSLMKKYSCNCNFCRNKEDELKAYDKLINHHKVSLIILNDTKFNDKRIKYLDKRKLVI